MIVVINDVKPSQITVHFNDIVCPSLNRLILLMPRITLKACVPSHVTALYKWPNTLDISMTPIDSCHLKQTDLIRFSTKCNTNWWIHRAYTKHTPGNIQYISQSYWFSSLYWPNIISYVYIESNSY